MENCTANSALALLSVLSFSSGRKQVEKLKKKIKNKKADKTGSRVEADDEKLPTAKSLNAFIKKERRRLTQKSKIKSEV